MTPEAPPAFTARRRVLRETLFFLLFVVLAVAMTWPWVLHLRDHVPDEGDPYLCSWVIWWNQHQLFTDPLNLFHSNLFFPYRYSLAFSEHQFGIALHLLPFFALGLRPLTVHGIGILLGYALCGYGAFRLTRTLSGSTGGAFVAGIAFAFLPYRLQHLSHLVYLWAGWIPLMFEALVLFAKRRTGRRAAWLGAAFLINGLCSIHWLVLTALPFAICGVVLAAREGALEDPAFRRRGGLALGIAGLCLLPFLVPYRRLATLYGFERNAAEAATFSADLASWLTVDPRVKLWSGFGEQPPKGERSLFPGLLLLMLPVASLLLTAPGREGSPARAPEDRAPPSRALIRTLDATAMSALAVAILAASPSHLKLSLFGKTLLTAASPDRALVLLFVVVATRFWHAYPNALSLCREKNLQDSLAAPTRPAILAVGLILFITGFAGSLGLNFFFHRFLFETIEIFRSIRAPARWAMVACLGLALLAGEGVRLIAERTRRGAASTAVFLILSAAILFEVHAVPLPLVRGAADPTPLALHLKETAMRGGIVELPIDAFPGLFESVLRAADHGRPLITATSGFSVPTVEKIRGFTAERPIPDSLFNHLESIPTSYVVLHWTWIAPPNRSAYEDLVNRGVDSGRLRFVKRFSAPGLVDLFAVAKTEPEAGVPRPGARISPDPRGTPVLANAREDSNLSGWVEAPSNGDVVTGRLTVVGWGRIRGEDLGVTVLIDGEPRPPSTFKRVPRPDVAEVKSWFGDFTHAGFEVSFEPRPGDDGPHDLSVFLATKDGRFRVLARRFEWRGAATP